MAFDTYNIHIHMDTRKLDKILKQNIEIMSALSDLKDLATRQGAAIAGVRGDITTLKEMLANNPNGIDAAGVEELKGLFGANADALEALDAETPPSETPAP